MEIEEADQGFKPNGGERRPRAILDDEAVIVQLNRNLANRTLVRIAAWNKIKI